MKIILQDEFGKTLGVPVIDERGCLHRILVAANANHLTHLQHLDLYGDTTFNLSQLGVVADEWARLMVHAQDDADRSFLGAVADLIRRADTHEYLKFVGD